MLKYDKEVVAALKTILPTHFEMTRTKKTLPCISYYESDNTVLQSGDTIEYANIRYNVTLLTKTLSEQDEYGKEIDSALHEMGFYREDMLPTFQSDSGVIETTYIYRALSREER